MDSSEEKYSRQILFSPIGHEGHARIRAARVGLVGLGALGSSIAETLVRAGIGTLVAIDRDVIEPSNLHRQGLYLEQDALDHLPKAAAAKIRLQAMNRDVQIETHVADFRSENAEDLFQDCDVLVDGTDSFETRYLLNDLAVSLGKPWVYGACVGATGMTATIIPGKTPCLTCLFPDPPPPGSGETCDTAGIIAPASQIVASLQVTECLKILTQSWDDLRPGLLSFELWPFRLIEIGTKAPKPRADCPTCVDHDFRFLEGEHETEGVVLCGRDSVQIRPAKRLNLDLEDLTKKLSPHGRVDTQEMLLEFHTERIHMTLFRDGRALIKGTTDPTVARQFYTQYLGS